MGDGMGHAHMVGMVGHSNIWWGWSLGVGLAQMVGMVGTCTDGMVGMVGDSQ